jgi:cellulose synthase operon protein C
MKSHLLYGMVAAILCMLWVAPARATGPETELLEATQELNRAQGAEAYTAVRRIWSQWAVIDPEQVERTLVDASTSPALSPAVRAYAGLVAAHARTRRGDADGARRRVAELGYVNQWLVVGPFDNEGKGGLSVDAGPEAEFGAALDRARSYTGKVRPVHWRSLPDAFPFGWVDAGALFRPQQNICFYASTVVWRDWGKGVAKAAPASVWVGAGGAYKLFINGKEVLSDTAYRMHDVDRAGALVTLPQGKSRVVVKACGADVAPSLSLRFAAPSGAPDPTLRFAADFSASAETVATNGNLSITRTDLGPVADFDKRIAAKQPKARDLEAYARYLVASSADDPAVHQARDLASRAADLEPSIERLLLAGELAEDYNQHRLWVTRARRGARRQTGQIARRRVACSSSCRTGGRQLARRIALLSRRFEAGAR